MHIYANTKCEGYLRKLPHTFAVPIYAYIGGLVTQICHFEPLFGDKGYWWKLQVSAKKLEKITNKNYNKNYKKNYKKKKIYHKRNVPIV